MEPAGVAYIEARSIPEPNSGCWLWLLSFGSHGYGNVSPRWGNTAPQASYLAHHGPISPGLQVLHTCGNRACVNPDHLYAGTHAQNMDDLVRAGTHRRRKLTTVQVAAIKASPLRQAALAAAYGVSQRTIWNILHGHCYRHG